MHSHFFRWEMRDGQEQELFARVHHRILREKLFLNPSFSRQDIINLGLFNKNEAARLIREFMHTNFNGYVNALRLDYARALMRQRPGMSVKAVAFEAGFNSVRTFNRVFARMYGQTPSEYREVLTLDACPCAK